MLEWSAGREPSTRTQVPDRDQAGEGGCYGKLAIFQDRWVPLSLGGDNGQSFRPNSLELSLQSPADQRLRHHAPGLIDDL